jgi:ribosomal protein L37E
MKLRYFPKMGFGHGFANAPLKANHMADILRDAPQEFWRPPVITPASGELAESCQRCGTEFMVGAAFCHICGAGRHRSVSSTAGSWMNYFGFLRAIEFSRIRAWFGLPLPCLWSFLIGVGFLIAAVSVSFIQVGDSLSGFEAIQLWRIQWLMAACAAFLVGILFKNSKSEH